MKSSFIETIDSVSCPIQLSPSVSLSRTLVSKNRQRQQVRIARLIVALLLVPISLGLQEVSLNNSLPFSLITFGVITSTALLGWRHGLLTGLVTASVEALLIGHSPLSAVMIYIPLVWITEILARGHAFKSYMSGIFSSVCLALTASVAIASTQMFIKLFSGPVDVGSLFSGLLQATFQSMILSGASSELINKGIIMMIFLTAARLIPNQVHFDFLLRAQKPSWEGRHY